MWGSAHFSLKMKMCQIKRLVFEVHKATVWTKVVDGLPALHTLHASLNITGTCRSEKTNYRQSFDRLKINKTTFLLNKTLLFRPVLVYVFIPGSTNTTPVPSFDSRREGKEIAPFPDSASRRFPTLQSCLRRWNSENLPLDDTILPLANILFGNSRA
jgi:hypothetical protein